MSSPNGPLHSARVEAGTLWNAVRAGSRHALACGALSPIDTVEEVIDDGGVRFTVRRVSSLGRKAAQRPAKRDDGQSGPRHFPVEPDLVVGEVSATHVALLNKFPVIADHLLLVTRQYAPQEALLDRADFAAWAAGLEDYEALGFYNGGVAAGASQPHKHLQLVPLPLGAEKAVPMEALLDRAGDGTGISTVPGLPFRHAFCACDASGTAAAERLMARYDQLLDAVGIHATPCEGVPHQSAPYNLLLTSRWMLIVPRTRADFHGIGVNGLGYAGSIFVKSTDDLERVRRTGPMAVLRAVAAPPA